MILLQGHTKSHFVGIYRGKSCWKAFYGSLCLPHHAKAFNIDHTRKKCPNKIHKLPNLMKIIFLPSSRYALAGHLFSVTHPFVTCFYVLRTFSSLWYVEIAYLEYINSSLMWFYIVLLQMVVWSSALGAFHNR